MDPKQVHRTLLDCLVLVNWEIVSAGTSMGYELVGCKHHQAS